MKIIAAVLMTLALALFPLSGGRAGEPRSPAGKTGVQHDHAPAASAAHDHGDASHHHAKAHQHEAPPAVADDAGCGGHDGQSNCCSLSCHAMAAQDPVAVPAWRPLASAVDVPVVLLPAGSGGDGLLRPPRPA